MSDGPETLTVAPDEPSKETDMHAHKPKPVHSWRELATEIVVIVIGVLIALSLEQAVENWREHKQYQEAREAMREELSFDVSNIRRRGEFEPCTRRRMQEIAALLDRSESHQVFEASSWIGDAISTRVRFTAEPDASRSGLFTTEEQATYGRMYSYLHSIDVEQDRERLAWARLRMLEGRSTLPPEIAYGLRAALADARYEHDRIQTLLGFLNALAPLAHIRGNVDVFKAANRRFAPEVPAHCLPVNTPKEKAEKLSRIITGPT